MMEADTTATAARIDRDSLFEDARAIFTGIAVNHKPSRYAVL